MDSHAHSTHIFVFGDLGICVQFLWDNLVTGGRHFGSSVGSSDLAVAFALHKTFRIRTSKITGVRIPYLRYPNPYLAVTARRPRRVYRIYRDTLDQGLESLAR